VRRLPCVLLGAVLALVPAGAQTVEIYSELQRAGPFGGIVAPDRAASPREILSPAVARNAWASFHLVVSAPPNTTYLLYLATNPRNACRVRMYREHFVRTRAGWIPDRLEEIGRLPDFGYIADPADGIEGQTARAYLLDVWVPPNAPVSRFRLEAQLRVGRWVVRPLEVRVLAARVPDLQAAGDPRGLPPVEAGADAAALDPLLAYLDGAPLRAYEPPATVRGIVRRNAIQDMALAATLAAGDGARDQVRDLWQSAVWSGARFLPSLLGAEWYLRVRDSIYTAASR